MTPPTHPPLVSVLLPVKNGLPHLRAALLSVLSQSLTAIEVIVIDDGSVDGSGRVARDLGDARVRVFQGGGLGVGHALNVGLAAARGEFIARQDADDLSSPSRLARQAAYLDQHRDVAVVASRVHFIDATGRATDTAWTRTVDQQWDAACTPDAIAALMPLTCCIVHGSVMSRRTTLLAHDGYDEHTAVEDYDLWLRLLPAHRFVKLRERLYSYRVHARQITATLGTRQAEHAVAAKLRFLRRQIPDLPRPARLALPVNDRGAAVYAAVGPTEGFSVATGVLPARWQEADVVAVTDFSAVPAWAAALTERGGYQRFGNLFVQRAAAGPGRHPLT